MKSLYSAVRTGALNKEVSASSLKVLNNIYDIACKLCSLIIIIINSIIVIYLLTYSMVQSPSWEANWFAASQEIPRISRNPKVHYRIVIIIIIIIIIIIYSVRYLRNCQITRIHTVSVSIYNLIFTFPTCFNLSWIHVRETIHHWLRTKPENYDLPWRGGQIKQKRKMCALFHSTWEGAVRIVVNFTCCAQF